MEPALLCCQVARKLRNRLPGSGLSPPSPWHLLNITDLIFIVGSENISLQIGNGFNTNRGECWEPVTIPVTQCHEVMTEECERDTLLMTSVQSPGGGQVTRSVFAIFLVIWCHDALNYRAPAGRWHRSRPIRGEICEMWPIRGPGPSTAPAAWRGISHIFVQITGHCSADAWEPWTDPLDPGPGGWRNSSFWKKWSVTDLRWSLMTWSARLVSPRSHPRPVSTSFDPLSHNSHHTPQFSQWLGLLTLLTRSIFWQINVHCLSNLSAVMMMFLRMLNTLNILC